MTNIISAVIVIAFLATLAYLKRHHLDRVLNELALLLRVRSEESRQRRTEAYHQAYITGYDHARALYLHLAQNPTPAARQRGGNDEEEG